MNRYHNPQHINNSFKLSGGVSKVVRMTDTQDGPKGLKMEKGGKNTWPSSTAVGPFAGTGKRGQLPSKGASKPPLIALGRGHVKMAQPGRLGWKSSMTINPKGGEGKPKAPASTGKAVVARPISNVRGAVKMPQAGLTPRR